MPGWQEFTLPLNSDMDRVSLRPISATTEGTEGKEGKGGQSLKRLIPSWSNSTAKFNNSHVTTLDFHLSRQRISFHRLRTSVPAVLSVVIQLPHRGHGLGCVSLLASSRIISSCREWGGVDKAAERFGPSDSGLGHEVRH
jgi:hypothetical protein